MVESDHDTFHIFVIEFVNYVVTLVNFKFTQTMMNLLGIPKRNLVTLFSQHTSPIIQSLEPFRINQIWQWMYQRGATSFNEMTNLSTNTRNALSENFNIDYGTLVTQQESRIDKTKKFLLEYHDKKRI